MRRFCPSVFSMIVALAILANPVLAAPSENNSAQKTVTASAVIVPERVSQLGFLISGIAKEVSVREGEAVKAGQTLIVLDTPNLEFTVAEAQAALRAAQADAEIRSNDTIKKYIINYETFTVKKRKYSPPHEVIEIANANVQRAQASVEIAQASLAQGTLTAPGDGTVASINVIPGEFVKSDQAVLTLATLDALLVETTDLSESDIPNVRVGDAANVFVEALDQNLSGKVIRISPIANTVGGDVVFKVTISLDEQPQGLLWGMTAEVEIESGE